jgi:NADP-dependent aldehyde dehydrogenase
VTTQVTTVASAAAGAAEAFASLPLEDRAALLERIAADLEAHDDELIAIADAETALGTTRLVGEVARTTGQLRMFASVVRDGAFLEVTIDHPDPAATPPRPDLRRYLLPVGPVGVFTASNFPFAFGVAGGDTASALAAGCPVVVKGHPGHPELSRRTAAIVGASVVDHGLAPGTFAHVEGLEEGIHLVEHPAIKAVGFTGSLEVGRLLFDRAAGRPDPIPFYGELSSINPVVVSPRAAERRGVEVARGLLASMTLGVGQFCTNPGIVLVPASHDLTAEVGALLADGEPVGEPRPMLNQRILDAYVDGVERLRGLGTLDVVAGSVTSADAGVASPIVFVTDVDGFRVHREILGHECFGPSSVLVRYDSLAQLEDLLRDMPGALTASLHAEEDEYDVIGDILARLRGFAGRIVVDGWPTGVAVTWTMHHGGPWPATTNALHTSVGATAARRFLRPITFQDAPAGLLPEVLHDDNPLGVPRRVDGRLELA